MDAHLPEDLRAVERRLVDWQPAQTELDTDRMLFAAGRASARPGKSRLLWPAAAVCLAVLASVLGAGLVRERAARLALAHELEQRPLHPAPAPPHFTPAGSEDLPEAPLSPASYLAARRALERDPDGWSPPADTASPSPGPAPPPTLRAWGPGTQIDP
jgi:hypothetical protein